MENQINKRESFRRIKKEGISNELRKRNAVLITMENERSKAYLYVHNRTNIERKMDRKS